MALQNNIALHIQSESASIMCKSISKLKTDSSQLTRLD